MAYIKTGSKHALGLLCVFSPYLKCETSAIFNLEKTKTIPIVEWDFSLRFEPLDKHVY